MSPPRRGLGAVTPPRAPLALLPLLLLLLAPGASAQRPAKAPRDRNKVTLHPAGTCTCQPCGCERDGSCTGSPGCAPLRQGVGYFGGAKPPGQRKRRARFEGKASGTSGIGFATAFVKECATVVITGRDRDRGQRAQAYLRGLSPAGCRGAPKPATFVAADVRNVTAMKALVKAAGDFQIAVNNAGVGGYGVRRLADVEESYLSDPAFPHDPIEINLRGLIISMHAELNHCEAPCAAAKTTEACSRVMIVTGSISGQVPSPRNAVYAASKAAANSLCRSVAAEYRQPVEGVFGGDNPLSVRINCIAPGPVNTKLALSLRDAAKSSGEYGSLYPWQCWQQQPNGGLVLQNGGVGDAKPCASIKLGEPANTQSFIGTTRGPNTRISDAAEQAAMILALAADDASFVTGTVVTVDGGYTAS